MEAPWLFPAKCVNVVDGDTIDVVLDVGFHATRTERLRLLGVNAPEMHGPSHDAGVAAKTFTTQTIVGWQTPAVVGLDWPLMVQTHKTDVFGRYLARVWPVSAVDETAPDLSALLLASGNAVVFKG